MNEPLMFEKTLRVTYRKKVFILINDCEQKQTEIKQAEKTKTFKINVKNKHLVGTPPLESTHQLRKINYITHYGICK